MKTKLKKCLVCNNDFISNSNNHKICSIECKTNQRKEYFKEYGKNNKESINESSRKYRANKKNKLHTSEYLLKTYGNIE